VREQFYDIEGDLWRSERKLSASLDPNCQTEKMRKKRLVLPDGEKKTLIQGRGRTRGALI